MRCGDLADGMEMTGKLNDSVPINSRPHRLASNVSKYQHRKNRLEILGDHKSLLMYRWPHELIMICSVVPKSVEISHLFF